MNWRGQYQLSEQHLQVLLQFSVPGACLKKQDPRPDHYEQRQQACEEYARAQPGVSGFVWNKKSHAEDPETCTPVTGATQVKESTSSVAAILPCP